MIADMEETCLSHFLNLVTAKIVLVATKSKADLRVSKKIVIDYISSKEFKQRKKLFHEEFITTEKGKKICVIS